MVKELLLILSIEFIILFILYLLSKKTKRQNTKYIELVYGICKTVGILLVSIIIFNSYDIHKVFGFIPKDQLSVNITFYSAFQALIIGILELIYTEKRAVLTINLYIKRDNEQSKDDLIIQYSDTENFRGKFYLLLEYKGDIKRIKNKNIIIKFPETLTAASGTVILNERQELIFSLDEHLTIDRNDIKEIPIDVMIRKLNNGISKTPELNATVNVRSPLIIVYSNKLLLKYK